MCPKVQKILRLEGSSRENLGLQTWQGLMDGVVQQFLYTTEYEANC